MPECFICGKEAPHRVRLTDSRKLSNGMLQPARYADACDRHQGQAPPEKPRRARRQIISPEQGVLFK